jgi:hypothetical protein
MHTLRILAAVQVAMLGYVIYRQRKMEKIMATVPAGLAANLKAIADVTDAITGIGTALGTLETGLASVLQQLQAATTEDPQVLAAAQALEVQVNALSQLTAGVNAAIATLPPAPAPAS